MTNENLDKPSFLKRVVAYLIDIILVTLLSTAISMLFIDNTNYKAQTEQLMNLTSKYTSNEITREEYTKQFDELNYYLTKEGVETTIVNCSVALVYYVILCYFCQGITLGKYLMKLRIVSSNDKELNMGHYLIRGLFANLILSNLISIIFVYSMNKDTFVSIYPKATNVLTVFMLASIIFVMYRKDGRGLHDLMSNTKVINTKVKVQETKEEVKEEIKEAKVIEEKKVENTTKKGSTKKRTKKEVK